MFSPITSTQSMLSSLVEMARRQLNLANVSDADMNDSLEGIINVFESIPLVLRALQVAKDAGDVILAFVMAFKLFTRGNVISHTLDIYSWVETQLKTMSASVTPLNGFEIQSGMEFDWCIEGAKSLFSLDKMKKGLGLYKSARHCALLTKMQDMFCYFISFGIITNLKFKNAVLKYEDIDNSSRDRALRSKKYDSLEGFILSMLENVVWIIERTVQAVQLGSFTPFLHNGDSYSKWVDLAHKVLLDQHKMSSPEAFADEGFNESNFHKDLDTVLEHGAYMLKYVTEVKEKSMISKVLTEVRIMAVRFKSKDYAQRDRKPPFSVLISGDSKICKSQFQTILFHQYGKVHKLDIAPERMWTRNPLDKFYSGYSPAKWCIRIDDIAQFSPNLGVLDPTLGDIIMIANGVAMVAPMGDLADKGVIPVRPQLLLATTNREDLNAHAYFSCPLAVRRRFPYVIHLEVKDEFCAYEMINGKPTKTTMVDESKIPPLQDGELMDIWNITLQKLIAAPGVKDGKDGSHPKLEPIAVFTDIYDFLELFSQLSITFGEHQSLGAVATEKMAQVEICPACYRPVCKCRCEVETGITQLSAEDLITHWELHGRFPDAYYEFIQSVHSVDDMSVQSTIRIPLRPGYVEILPLDSDTESDEDEMIANAMLDYDRRTLLTKCLDWCDDQLDIAHALARVAVASGRCTLDCARDTVLALRDKGIEISENMLTRVGDILIFYQLRKFRKKFSDMGDQIQSLWRTWKVELICGLLIGGWTLYKVSTVCWNWIKKDDELQGGSPSVFIKDDKENPWIRDEMILSDYYVPTMTSGWKNSGLSSTDILHRIGQNVVHIDAEFIDDLGPHYMPATATCISGFLYMTNNHCLPEVHDLTIHMSSQPNINQLTQNIAFKLVQSQIYRLVDQDLAFFQCRCTPPRADLSKLFFKKQFKDLKCVGAYVHCRKNEFRFTNSTAILRPTMTSLLGTSQVSWLSKVKETTVKGDCGSPLVAFTPAGPIILGIHQFACKGEDQVGAVEVLDECIEFALKAFEPQPQCGEPSFITEHLGPLNDKSVLRWETEGQARVYGSTVRSSFRSAPKSHVVDTIISQAAQDEGFVKRCVPPVMKGPEVWHKNVEPTVTQEFCVDATILEECVTAFSTDVTQALCEQDFREMIILDDVAALNGIRGVKFIDKINRNTSMGYPYRKSKRNFLVPVECTEDYPDAMEYSAEVKAEVELIKARYAVGQRYMPVFSMSLKDEPVTEEKARIKKTRGFMGGPAAWQLVVRKHLLAFVRVFQRNPFIFEGAPGMNVNSCTWFDLYEYLTTFGEDRIVAGDYAKFDKRMSPQFIMAAFDFICLILKSAGWSEEQLLVIQCIACDIAFPVTDVQGDFVEFLGSNPSGHALTVIVNCIVNSLYMRYVFALLAPVGINVAQFKNYVKLITYGDDNTMGVSNEASFFNHTAIQAALAKIKVVYTMADKESASVPFVSIRDITFLKRRFVVEKDGRVSCPLEWASIEKMLTTCVQSKSVGPEKQAIDTIRSAIGEFFQYGPVIFEQNVRKMRKIIEVSGISDFVEVATFPTYDQLLKAHYLACTVDCERCSCALERLE